MAAAETAPEDRARAFADAKTAAGAVNPHDRSDAARDLAVLGEPDELFMAMRPLLADTNVGVRMAATAAIANLPWKKRIAELVDRLEDDDLGIAVVAAQGLAHANHKGGVEILKGVLGERRVRFDALESLYELHETSHLDECRKILGGLFSSAFEKGMAALTLAREGDAKARAYVLKHVADRKAEARPLFVVHLATALGAEGRAYLEKLASDDKDYLRESALLALARVDRAFVPRLEEAISRFGTDDPHVAGEVLLGLFDLDWEHAAKLAEAHLSGPGDLGAAARTVRLAAHLRRENAREVLLRCD